MTAGLKNILRQLGPRALRPLTWTQQALRPAIRILMYHRVARLPHYDQLTVTPERFEEQMAHLAGHHRVIGLNRALEELDGGRRLAPAVVVTFDDGYRDNLTHALPILRKFDIPATIFVTARFCDQSARHPRYAGETGQLHLDWNELRTLVRQPGITVGSHTLTHPFLSRLPETQARDEIAESRRFIAAQIGAAVDFFCYPSGDLTPREMALVAAAGYRGAVSVAPGVNRDATERYALRRTEMTDRDGAGELALKIDGAFDLIHSWLHRRRERSFAQARVQAPRTSSGDLP